MVISNLVVYFSYVGALFCALLHLLAPFGTALLRTCVCPFLLLRSFALFCTFLHLTALGRTAFGNFSHMGADMCQ